MQRFNKRWQVLVAVLLIGKLSMAQQLKLMLPYGHKSVINSASFSTDGSKIVTSSSDQTVIVWNTKTGYVLTYINDLKGEPRSAVFSHDDKKLLIRLNITDTSGAHINSNQLAVYDLDENKLSYFNKKYGTSRLIANFSTDASKIVTVTHDDTVAVWDWRTGERVGYFVHPGGNITDAHFLSKGNRIIASAGKSCIIWDAVSGKPVNTLNGHTANIISIDISPDETRAITTNLDHTRIVWDLQAGKQLNTINDPDVGRRSLAFSQDSRFFITVAGDQPPELWQAGTGNFLKRLNKIQTAHSPGDIRFSRFTPDGKYVLCTFSDSILLAWDIRTGELVHAFGWKNSIVGTMQISPDCNYLLSSSTRTICMLWDIRNGALLVPYKGNVNQATYASFNNDGSRIVTASSRDVHVWDASTYELLYSLKGHNGTISKVAFSPDENLIVTAGNDSTIKVWSTWLQDLLLNINTGCDATVDFNFDPVSNYLIAVCSNNRPLEFLPFDPANHKFEMFKDYKDQSILEQVSVTNGAQIIIDSSESTRSFALYSPAGDQLLLQYQLYGGAVAYERTTGKALYSLADNSFVSNASFSSDGKKILTGSTSGTPKLWSAISTDETIHQPLLTLKGHTGRVNSAVFSKDGRLAVTASSDKTARIWDLQSGKTLQTLTGHTGEVLYATFDPGGKRVITASSDNTYKIWNVQSGRLMVTLVQFDSTDYLLLDNNGYYHSTGRANNLVHYVSKDLKFISFDQLDIRFNRPDKVLESMECPNKALINEYRMAWYERMKNLEIDTSGFSGNFTAPYADILNKDTITENNKFTLFFKAQGQQVQLSRYNIWINGVPLFGMRGVDITNKKINRFNGSVAMELSPGSNKIEFSVTNVQGVESYRQALFVSYQPQIPPVEKLYFVGIGINRFANETYPLEWCVNDVRALAKTLEGKLGSRFVLVDTLFNEQVTTKNIRRLKSRLQKMGVNDQVIVAYAGHGLFSADSRYFLSSYSIDFEKPEEKGIPYSELENLVDSIPSRKKLLLIDACNSGEKSKLGSENSFALMKQLFVNVKKGTGAFVIAAAQGYQSALENRIWEHGAFTKSILDALDSNDSLTVSGLGRLVEAKVISLTGGKQQPVTRSQSLDTDWNLW